MNKKLAVFLYIFWGITLTLILSFGSEVGKNVLLKSKEIITELIYDYDIEDIVVYNEGETFIIGKTQSLDYKVIASSDKNPGLIFKSLDPDYIAVNSGGGFTGKRTDEEKTSGRIEITSKSDPKFKKIVTMYFEKKYPDVAQLSIIEKSYGANPKEITVGIPINLGVTIPQDQIYSEKDYVISYDKEVFEEISENCLVAIKETDSTDLSVILGNGAVFTKTIKVVKGTEATDFEIINTWCSRAKGFTNVEGYKFRVNELRYFYLFKEDKRVITDFEIISDSLDITTNEYGGIKFSKIGNYQVEIKLPNGYSRVITCVVENEMKFPEISNL